MRNKVELLAPAGSPEGIRAAVQSGAGAVYMGFGMFNARRNAQGFSHDEMADAIAYCRARDVKTNITLNILAGDRELEDALEDAKFLYEAGADALIIQDLGLARLIHAHAPDFALHASTQMTIHTLDAAKQARDIGFSRVVLSRECSREEIKLITEQAGVETEVFVHGALCMCYSGQCYLSAVIGQRSGNRGLCAQPCRLPYSGGYPLSLKDLMLAGHVAELSDWGVSSLKIEGRMKRPEYAAIVTKVYSDLLREHRRPTAEERDILRRVFSRDGFTDGYYTGKLGDSMFGTKTDVPMNEVKKLYDEAAHRFAEGKEAPLVPVSLCFTARKDTGAVLSADGVSVVMPVEQAQNRPTTPEMIEKSLRKTGGTPFVMDGLAAEPGEGGFGFLPGAAWNELRREALDKLLEKRSEVTPHAVQAFEMPTYPAHTVGQLPALAARFANAAQCPAEAAEKLQYLIFPITEAESIPEAWREKTLLELPRVMFGRLEQKTAARLDALQDAGFAGAVVNNPAQLRYTDGWTLYGGLGLNVTNPMSAARYASLGVQGMLLQPETALTAMQAVAPGVPTAGSAA